MQVVTNSYQDKNGNTVNEQMLVTSGVIKKYLTDGEGNEVRTNGNGNEYRVAAVTTKFGDTVVSVLTTVPLKLSANDPASYEVGATIDVGSKKIQDERGEIIVGKVYLAPISKEETLSAFDMALKAVASNESVTVEG